MFGLSEPLAAGISVSVQIIGVISLIVARLNGNCVRHQLIYFAALFTVAGLMFATIATGSADWILFAITIAIMVVGATVDLSRGRTLQSTQFGA